MMMARRLPLPNNQLFLHLLLGNVQKLATRQGDEYLLPLRSLPSDIRFLAVLPLITACTFVAALTLSASSALLFASSSS